MARAAPVAGNSGLQQSVQGVQSPPSLAATLDLDGGGRGRLDLAPSSIAAAAAAVGTQSAGDLTLLSRKLRVLAVDDERVRERTSLQ